MSEELTSWLLGDLSPLARLITAAAPALALLAWVGVATLFYARRNRRRGRFVDPEMERRGSSLLLGMGVRQLFAWMMQPAVRLLLRTGVPAHAVTTLSVLLALGSAVSLAAGRFALGGWLLVAASLCDYFDGRIARARGTAGPRGALLDSVLDRYVEAAVFLGLAWYYRDSWVLLPVLVALVGSLLVSYIRARGESLGASLAGVGLMQRPERMVVLAFSLALAPIVEVMVAPEDPRPVHRLAVAGILLVAVATQITAGRRLLSGLSSLSPARGPYRLFGRGGVARSVISSTLATALDFALVVLLVSAASLSPALATFLGAVAGGATSFALGRLWAFDARGGYGLQGVRYAAVSLSSAGLNAGGVAVLLLLPAVAYPAAWAIARLVVFLAWNYPLHRDWVFDHDGGEGRAGVRA